MTVCLLGSNDPEMCVIRSLLVACGIPTIEATSGGRPVTPSTAYQADKIEVDQEDLVCIECAIPGWEYPIGGILINLSELSLAELSCLELEISIERARRAGELDEEDDEEEKPTPPEEGWEITLVTDEWLGDAGDGEDDEVWIAVAPGGTSDGLLLTHHRSANYVVSPHSEHRDGSALRIWSEELGWLTPQQWVE